MSALLVPIRDIGNTRFGPISPRKCYSYSTSIDWGVIVNANLLHGFYLGDLLVEPLKGRVSGRTGSEHLPPKAADVLLQLASQPGELVTRDALLAAVWGDGQGSQETLSHAVSEIRHALNDHSEDPQYIQTMPKRGYRLLINPEALDRHDTTNIFAPPNGSESGFTAVLANLNQRGVLEAALAYLLLGWLLIQVADVVFDQLLLPQWVGTFVTVLVIAGFPIVLVLSWYLEFRDGRAVLDSGTDHQFIRKRFSRTYLSVLGALTVASIGVLAYDQLIGLPVEIEQAGDDRIASEDILPIQANSIAVLRFLNIDGSEQTQVFASGFAEDVINRLARIPGLSVSSRGDSWSLNENSSSEEVRRRLRVAYYLEGSVRLTDNLLRVVVQLIDSDTGFHIVSRDFERELMDFNQVQKDITDLTIANLRIALPAETQTILYENYKDADLDAYVLYRKAKAILDQPRTFENLQKAITHLTAALEIDPGYPAAHAGLCNAYVHGFEMQKDTSLIDDAERACAAALSSNPNLNIVYTALANLYRYTGRIDAAEAAFDKALEIDSRDVMAMQGLASVYHRQKKFELAEGLLLTAIATQPGNWRAISSYGGFLFATGRYQQAVGAYRKLVLMDPGNFEISGNLGSALLMAGNYEEARVVLEASIAANPYQRFYSNLGIIHYYLGQYDESVNDHEKAVELSPDDALMWLNLADALYFSGRTNEATGAFLRGADMARRQLDVDATDTEAMFSLAWARQMLGGSEEAQRLVKRALEISPNDPYGYYYDALIKTRLGQYDAAIDALGFAVAMGYPSKMLTAEPYLEELRLRDDFNTLVSNLD